MLPVDLAVNKLLLVTSCIFFGAFFLDFLFHGFGQLLRDLCFLILRISYHSFPFQRFLLRILHQSLDDRSHFLLLHLFFLEPLMSGQIKSHTYRLILSFPFNSITERNSGLSRIPTLIFGHLGDSLVVISISTLGLGLNWCGCHTLFVTGAIESHQNALDVFQGHFSILADLYLPVDELGKISVARVSLQVGIEVCPLEAFFDQLLNMFTITNEPIQFRIVFRPNQPGLSTEFGHFLCHLILLLFHSFYLYLKFIK